LKHPVTHLRAIGYALSGFTLWVLSDVCMKLAGENDLPPYEIVGFLGLVGVIIVALRAWPRGEIKTLWPKNPRAQFIRSLLALTTVFLNVIALKHLPLTIFYVTVFTAPMMIAIMAAFFLREHLSGMKILAVIAGFIGVVVAINPNWGMAEGGWVGYAAAFAGTVCFAVNMVWLRNMTRSESITSMAFFTAMVQTIFGFGAMLFHAEAISSKLLLILILMGSFSIAGNLVSYLAFKYTTAANVAQFHYTQIIAGTALGYLIWHDVPALHLIIGALIIIASGLYIATQASKTQNIASVGQH
jgi:drug/metabolite transporter (DMT)-like permease